MKIIKQGEDFRGWKTFIVETIDDKEGIEKYFQYLYPINNVCAMELFNLKNTWEITLLPKEKYLKVFNIKWNDVEYVNEWFEVGPYDNEGECDVQGQITQQEDDCNESEDRDDLKIISYEYEFVSE